MSVTVFKKEIQIVVRKEDIQRMVDRCFELEHECTRALCLKALAELLLAAVESTIPEICK